MRLSIVFLTFFCIRQVILNFTGEKLENEGVKYLAGVLKTCETKQKDHIEVIVVDFTTQTLVDDFIVSITQVPGVVIKSIIKDFKYGLQLMPPDYIIILHDELQQVIKEILLIDLANLI